MKCPYCGGKSGVLDSRFVRDHKWRRRRCQECGKTFSTWERYSKSDKKDGTSYDLYVDMIKMLQDTGGTLTLEQENNIYMNFIASCMARIADSMQGGNRPDGDNS